MFQRRLIFIYWYILKINETNSYNHLRNIFNEILKNNSILDKVEFDKATNYPLPMILSKAHVHLSKYSGSVIEAAQMGVKTIVLDPIGVNAYKNQIHEGSAIGFTTGSASQLIGIIESINNKFTNKEVPAYKSVLNQLL